MSIEFTTDSIFKLNTRVIVNPVNCVGVMGSGLALQFKNKYPDYFIDYKNKCDEGFGIGELHYYNIPRTICSFPTKVHWKDKSKLEYIEIGLIRLKEDIISHGGINGGIAIPKLGCGLGGLDWRDVKSLIVDILGDLDQCRIIICI